MSQHMSRRSMLGLAAGSALSVVVSQSLLGCAADAVTESSRTSSDSTGTTTSTSCVLTAALTEGPYFVDEKLYRSDIRSDPVTGEVSVGALLGLTFNVSRVASSACTPLTGAYLDVCAASVTWFVVLSRCSCGVVRIAMGQYALFCQIGESRSLPS